MLLWKSRIRINDIHSINNVVEQMLTVSRKISPGKKYLSMCVMTKWVRFFQLLLIFRKAGQW